MSAKKSIRIKNSVFFVFLFVCFSFADGFASEKKYEKVPGGLDTLIEVSNDQKEMQSVLNDETRNYKKVKRAVGSDLIRPGDQASEISDKYGQPVVKLRQAVDLTEKWVYKPGKEDFFSGEQIWLIFDEFENLESIQYLPEVETEREPEAGNS